MPFFQKQKNKFLKHHYEKEQIHPQQFEPIIDPNLVSLIEWVIYVGKWMPGQIGSYGKLVQVIWEVYKGYYENKTVDELFGIAIAGMSKSRTKRFILTKFFNSFKHVFINPSDLSKKPEFKYLKKPKQQQLSEIESHQNQIKNYILSQVAQRYGNQVAQKVESKYGDNFSEIILSSIITMAAQGVRNPQNIENIQKGHKIGKLKVKEKKYCFF